MIKEIKVQDLNAEKFITEKVNEIRAAVGSGTAINALSGGVDSSVVTMLGHRALGTRLRTVFIQNGLMREGEAKKVADIFRKLGVTVEIIEAQKEFLEALQGITDPEQKREAITQTFYKKVFGRIVVKSNSKFLLQGTILTDVDETVAGIKRQHNVFAQLGIDPQKAFGYQILEPLVQLRKDGVRMTGKALGLPEEMFNRIPFPGPALVIGYAHCISHGFDMARGLEEMRRAVACGHWPLFRYNPALEREGTRVGLDVGRLVARCAHVETDVDLHRDSGPAIQA